MRQRQLRFVRVSTGRLTRHRVAAAGAPARAAADGSSIRAMPAEPTLAQLRHEMDALNAQLVELLHARGRLCRAIGAWKARHGHAAADPAREDAMLAALLQETPADGYSRVQVEAILRAVFAASRARVAGMDGVAD